MSWSPEDHLRHFMYEDIFLALAAASLPPAPQVLDFGSPWYGDPDGGWRTHLRSMLKVLTPGLVHTLATYPEYDIEQLALPASSVDILVADQVLEHVQRPWRAATEIARVVRTGGVAVVATPGLYPIHRSPLDCWRIMPDGYDVLFPATLWRPLTKSMWGSAARVAMEYAGDAFPDGPPALSVQHARADATYVPGSDGRCPLMLWFVGLRTTAPPEAV